MPSRRTLLVACLACLALTAFATPAHAAGSPNIGLQADAPASVLLGSDATVTLTASNPSGQPTGYNLSFRDVLPAGVSYVAGSTSVLGADVEPQVIANAPGAGQTTLVWSNVSDLSPNSQTALTYQVRHSTSTWGVGSSYGESPGAFIANDPRYIPKFNADGTPNGPSSTSYTGYDTASTSTAISAIDLTQAVPGALLRGVHDHQAVYALRLDNNSTNPTSGLQVDTYLPAGLEFLGCGDVDNTTDAATNRGHVQEWSGSGTLDGHTASPANCTAPSLVETLSADPDGAGPMPTGIYTHVRWTGLAALTANETRYIRFVAAVPIRSNTLTWTGATPTIGSLGQAANLDNNSGAETFDEQALTTYSKVTGTYNGTTPVSDEDRATTTAEDVLSSKSVDQGNISAGDIDHFTLTVKSSEYRYVDNVRVTDTLPNGLCPVDASDLALSATCAPSSGTDQPSSPYTSAVENNDGTWTILWNQTTDFALSHMEPNDTRTITFPVRVLSHYRANQADAAPVLARDSWSNAISVAGADSVRCDSDPDCATGTKIDHDEVDGVDDTDAASAAQSAPAPTIDEQVRATGGAVAVDCTTGSYIDTVATTYGPGDRVCFKLRVDFPAGVTTGNPQVTDFLPPGTTYDPGSYQLTANNTAPVQSFSSGTPGVLSWQLGDGSGYAPAGSVFEAFIAAVVSDPSAGADADVKGNLMKFASTNSAGQTVPLRDESDFEWGEAQLGLTESIKSINTSPAGGNPAQPQPGYVDSSQVAAGDQVVNRVDVSNSGSRDATGTEVWEVLPAGLACADVGAISDGGTCDAVHDRIVWTGLSVAAGASKGVTYAYTVPAGAQPATTYTHHAGVRTYDATSNLGTPFTYYPTSNIDASVTAGMQNTAAADDTTALFTGTPTLSVSRTSVAPDSGNNASQATIGERIDYTVTLTIPAGTTLNGSPNAVMTDDLGSRQTFDPAQGVVGHLNGGALPGGVTATQSGNVISLDFPAGYTNATSSPQTFTVTFSAYVNDQASNNKGAGSSLSDGASFAYDAGTSSTPTTLTSNTVTTTLVEPNIALGKSSNVSGTVAPGQTIRYTLSLTNPTATRVSGAYDSVITDTLPAGVTPVDSGGAAIADGGATYPDGGAWNQTARTITFTKASMAPGAAAATFRYDVAVDDPQPANSQLLNNAVATTTSVAGAPASIGTERDATSASGLGVSGYRATASKTVNLADATLTKSVSAPTATIGAPETYTLDVTIPGGVNLYDTTVRDLLPDGMRYDGLVDATCISGCSSGAISTTELPHVDNADGTTQLGFFLDDISAAPAGADRVVRIRYAAHVLDQRHDATKVNRGQTLVNSAAVYDNRSDLVSGTPAAIPAAGSFQNASATRTATVTVTEPNLTIAKVVSKGAGNAHSLGAQPTDHLTYTVTVNNTGDAPAADVVVLDHPDAELVNVTPSAGVSTTDLTDGWSVGDPAMRWDVPSIAPGGSVTLTYTADLDASASLHEADVANNTAHVPTYWAYDSATRLANPAVTYRQYTSDPSDSDAVAIDLPRLSVANTTGSGAESGNAEVGQPFTWKVVASNTSATATAKNVDVSYRLPRNWSYVPGSASFGGDPVVAPDAVNGDLLTWTNVTDLAPGGSRTITFQATPTLAAETDPGSGAGNPNVTRASITGDDASGASSSADGPYQAGPDPAQAILLVPDLHISKTPDSGSELAGTTPHWTITVSNTGTGTARGVHVADDMPDPATYTAGAATSPDPGFAESSAVHSGGSTHIDWSLSNLGPGASTTITVPYHLAADLASATTQTNHAAVTATEEPAGVSDDGSVTIGTQADVGVTKTADSSPFAAGTDVSWTLVARNNGPSDAHAVTVADTLPATTTSPTFTGADAAGCSAVGQAVTCSYGTLAPGDQRTVVVHAHLAASATGTVDNTAHVTTTTTDGNPANDSSSTSTPIDEATDLRLTKSTPDDPVLLGDDITYSLKVDNLGESDAHSVHVTDTLPAGVAFASASAGCANAAGTVTCDLGTIAAHGTKTATITVTTTAIGTPDNHATVTTTSHDTNAANDADHVQTTVLPRSGLAITKAGPATVTAGATATYTLTVANGGPSDATGVTVSDTLPNGLDYVSDDGGCADASGTLTCVVGNVANGATATIHVTARAQHAKAEQTLTNTAAVTGDQADPDQSDNTDSVDTTVGPSADLAVAKTASSPVIHQNRTLTYTLVVDNHGPSTAQAVTVTDPLPSEVTFVSASAPCHEAAGTVTCNLGSLANGASQTVSITVRAVTLGSAIHNVATVSSSTPDGDASNNSSTADIDVGPTAELGLTKDGPSSAAPDSDVTYTLAATNNGPSPATNARISDPLPAGMTFVSATPAQGSCSQAAGTVTCALGGIAVGATVQVEVKAHATFAAAGQTVVNTATVTADEDDTDPSNNSASHPVAVDPAADLRLVKLAPASVPSGGQLLYTLNVSNAGPQDATGAAVVDTLPDGLRIVSAQPSQGACAAVGQKLTCQLGAVASGGGVQILLATEVSAPQGTQLTNTAAVSGDRPDPDRSNNAGTAGTAVGPPAPAGGLAITKVADSATAELGHRLGYTITVRNVGNQPATGVVVSDQPSGSVEVDSVRPSQGRCNRLICSLGTLPAGATATIRVVITPTEAGGLENSATVLSDQGTANAASSVSHATVTVHSRPTTIRVTQRTPSRVVVAGHVVSYTVIVRNTGRSAASNVRVCQSPTSHVTFLRAAGATLHRGQMCWTIPYLGVGASRTFHVRVRVSGDARGRIVSPVTAHARNARSAHARAPVKATALGPRRGGGVTG